MDKYWRYIASQVKLEIELKLRKQILSSFKATSFSNKRLKSKETTIFSRLYFSPETIITIWALPNLDEVQKIDVLFSA